MEKEKNLEEIYYKSVSEIGTRLFAEFLSDESRKRQANLLLSSIIAISLSFTLINPTQVSIGIITADSMNSRIYIFLSGLTCFYFITIYILSIMQDLEVYKFRKMPLTLVWHDLNKKIYDTDKDYKEELNKTLSLINERAIRRMALSEIIEELESKLQLKADKSKDSTGFTPLHSVSKVSIPIDPAREETFAKLDRVWEEYYQTTEQDGVDEVLDQQSELMKKRHELFIKELFLLNLNEKYNRINKIKILIEIGFPISLGIVGIGSTIFALFQ